MRAAGQDIWKGFACFSSFGRLGSLASSQERAASAQVTSSENQRNGKELKGTDHSVELLMLNESTPVVRKHL